MEVKCDNCGKIIIKRKSAVHKTNFCNKFNDLSNLVCVCKKCHYEVFHSKGWRD